MRKIWTKEENELFVKIYADASLKTMMNHFPGRTQTAIYSHARSLCIGKSEAYMKSPESGRISKANDIGFNTRFQEGMGGWNKGMKQADYMKPEQIEKTKATRFKKGQDPHNTNEIGSVRVSKDGYMEIKVRHLKNGEANNKNYELLHRFLYRNHHGTIPKGCNVYFVDGNKRNFEIDNLGLITKGENLIRNALSDVGIVKRFLGVREPELIGKIMAEMPEIIELKRKSLLVCTKLNKKKKEVA